VLSHGISVHRININVSFLKQVIVHVLLCLGEFVVDSFEDDSLILEGRISQHSEVGSTVALVIRKQVIVLFNVELNSIKGTTDAASDIIFETFESVLLSQPSHDA